MSKENNQFKIDHALPGLCGHCHTEIAEFEGSNKLGIPTLKRWKPNARSERIALHDGSIMTVMLCDDCYPLKAENLGPLMESEIKGWAFEINVYLPHKWSVEKRKKHLLHCKKFYATGKSFGKQGRNFNRRELKNVTKPRKSVLAKLRVT